MASKYILILALTAVCTQSFAQIKPANSALALVPVEAFIFEQSLSKAALEAKAHQEKLQEMRVNIEIAEGKARLDSIQRSMAIDKTATIQPSKLLPRVISVIGTTNNLVAQLVFEGGTIRRIKKGDQLGSLEVKSISMDQVILTDGEQINLSLPFATHLSIEEAIKESLQAGSQPNPNPFAAPQAMPVFDRPLPSANR